MPNWGMPRAKFPSSSGHTMVSAVFQLVSRGLHDVSECELYMCEAENCMTRRRKSMWKKETKDVEERKALGQEERCENARRK